MAELPLMRAENQAYIHYRKGSIVMMALVDILGENQLNHSLKRFIDQYKFQSERYPTSLDLLAFITADATVEQRSLIDSLFGQIHLYDLKTTHVAVEALPNQQFAVAITVNARKLNVDGQGQETDIPLAEMIDIGLFLADPDDISVDHADGSPAPANSQLLYLHKHPITSGENIINIIVNQAPLFVGIDPFIKLIDRDSEDNMIKI